ncbi:MAG: MAPEG family protein [Lysobacter sp.]
MLLTPVYASLFALVFVYLSSRTVQLRDRYKVTLGDGDQPVLMRAIRAHANFVEYVPLALLLLYFVETQTEHRAWVNVMGPGLLIARISHAYGISQVGERLRFRVTGMVLTGVVLLVCAIALIAGHMPDMSV